LGGDVASSPGPIVIDVTAVGEAPSPVLRSGAAVGDELWVSGELGGAGVAVHAWLRGSAPPAASRERFAAPQARVAEARWLAERGLVHAMIDVSDGLAGDAAHLAAAGGVRIEIEAAAIPVHPTLAAAAATEMEAVQRALTAGEDYEICFAAPAGEVEALRAEFEASFGVGLARVGRVLEGEGVAVRDGEGEPILPELRGYQHFETPG
jgi:thiamine-monophosphate kinase